MSVEEKKATPTNSPRNRIKRQVIDTVGSQYALQVALQTMKERCQQLQQRLAAEEEENLRLRTKLTSVKNYSGDEHESDDELLILQSPRRNCTNLEEKVTRLSRQNSQLRHHLFMVASENRQLWCRLSSVTEANQSLGNQLTKISLTLASQNGVSNLPHSENNSDTQDATSAENDKSNQITGKDDMTSVHLGESKILLPSVTFMKSQGSEEQSLEEMSLKLLKNLLQEKKGLEQQYAEMVKMHSESSSFGIPNLDFGYFEDCHESTLEQLAAHHRKLCEMKEELRAQHDKLKLALDNLSSRKNDAACDCVEKATMTGTPTKMVNSASAVGEVHLWGEADLASYRADIRQQLVQVVEPPGPDEEVEVCPTPLPAQDEVRMCPLCQQLFDMSTCSFEGFAEHVYAHFHAEEADPALNNFEIIPQ